MSEIDIVPSIAEPLDAALKARWLEALRSGRYPQGQVSLLTRSPDGDGASYCCLGVLALVSGVAPSRLAAASTLDHVNLQCLLGSWSASDEDPKFYREAPNTHTTAQRKLAAMNDNGMSFRDIADWIEANL